MPFEFIGASKITYTFLAEYFVLLIPTEQRDESFIYFTHRYVKSN